MKGTRLFFGLFIVVLLLGIASLYAQTTQTTSFQVLKSKAEKGDVGFEWSIVRRSPLVFYHCIFASYFFLASKASGLFDNAVNSTVTINC